MLEHGGKLRTAARRWGIPVENWLDLSTGVSPFAYPYPDSAAALTVPGEHWQRLPEEDDGLEEAARNYYEADYLLPVAGSQAAIQALPRLRPDCKAGFLSTTYNEHMHAWKRQGHHVSFIEAAAGESSQSNENLIANLYKSAERLDVIVLVNPNNPTGTAIDSVSLLNLSTILAKRGGWLIVDEAFIDAETRVNSLASATGENEALIVLRSLGKFFGLAGTRVGFVLAWRKLLIDLREELGPWTINGPARYIAQKALTDSDWIAENRLRLRDTSISLKKTLCEYGLTPSGHSQNFQWVETPHAREIHQQLAQQGVLTRLFEDPLSLRFGLPGEGDWEKLELALNSIDLHCQNNRPETEFKAVQLPSESINILSNQNSH